MKCLNMSFVCTNIKQVLKATTHKTTVVQPPTTHHKNYKVRGTRHTGYYYRSKDELKSDILQWTCSHGQAKARRLVRTYIQQIFANTG